MYSINILYIIQYFLVYGQVPYFNNQSHLALSSTTLTLKNSIQMSTQILKKGKKGKKKTCPLRKVGDGGVFLFYLLKLQKYCTLYACTCSYNFLKSIV